MNTVLHIYLMHMANSASPEFVFIFFFLALICLEALNLQIQPISGKSVIVTSFSSGQGVALSGQ